LNIFVNQISRFLVAAFCLCVASNPVFAAKAKVKAKQPEKVNEGVVLYNKGEYAAALPILITTIKASPTDPLYHYYLGLCYDRLHSGGSAKGQFVWVARHSKDKRLRSYAETALHGNSSIVSTGTRAAVEPASEPAADSSSNSTSASNGASSDANYGVSSRLPYGRCKIYFFESANKESQQFAPIFDAAARSYRGSLNFQRLDVSDPATVSLLRTYKVNTFPHLIYLDGKGTEIYNEGPRTFNTRLTELLGK
jgi:tetratricopeptide (TPR) repeat protein